MRRRGLLTDTSEILGRGAIAKSLVRPVVIEVIGEGVDEGLQLIEALGQFVGLIELVAP